MLQKKDGRYEVYGNPITERQSRAADAWKDMLAKKRKLNLEVAALLETFYRETGMSIRGIYVESEEAN